MLDYVLYAAYIQNLKGGGDSPSRSYVEKSLYIVVTLSWLMYMDLERVHFFLESNIQDHHIYKSILTLLIGVLQTTIESGNEHDRFVVAVTKDNNTVGHTMFMLINCKI